MEGPTGHEFGLPVGVGSTFFVAVVFATYGPEGWTSLAVATSESAGQRVGEAWEQWADRSWNNISDSWREGLDGRDLWMEATLEPLGTGTENGLAQTKSGTLAAVYPNPFVTRTTIPFRLKESARVRLVVSDLLGRSVSVLVDNMTLAGSHTATFDATGYPAGAYVVTLESGGKIESRMVVVAR
jgi:hypothetical protein